MGTVSNSFFCGCNAKEGNLKQTGATIRCHFQSVANKARTWTWVFKCLFVDGTIPPVSKHGIKAIFSLVFSNLPCSYNTISTYLLQFCFVFCVI